MKPAHTAPQTAAASLPAGLILVLAFATGLSVASIYYAQPILPLMGAALKLDVNGMGLIPTLTQLGYALGIFFLLPLGDRYDRRHLILLKCALLAVLLALYSFSASLTGLLGLSLLVGMAATVAQDIVPAAAILAPAGKQGKMVGTVMTGLLLGILLSRSVSGLVGAAFGWRVMYQLAAVSIAFIGLLLWRVLPRFAAHSELGYPALMKSLVTLWRRYPALRQAAFAQGFLSIGFSAFWSMLAVMLHNSYHVGSAAAGAFGLAGAAGALAAPLSGTLSDRFGPQRVTQLGAALVSLSFALMFTLPFFGPGMQLAIIAIAAIGFDLGLQSTLVAHQTLVYSLEPAARGRLNALLFTVVFIGMALGSILGSKAYTLAGWPAVVALATVVSLISLAIRLAGKHAPLSAAATR
ncbi:MFS transporter [Franconibacter pulveris 601]|uniref:MFS transporter n=1 Tax=Franconibacter TaxID=1649295 RepID=UPI000462F15E|nr:MULTISPECIES: MFS transporter [Franconibacter]GGD12897.1 MFS transporter [Franconibacter daqui]